jgi:hypothetical protein
MVPIVQNLVMKQKYYTIAIIIVAGTSLEMDCLSELLLGCDVCVPIDEKITNSPCKYN